MEMHFELMEVVLNQAYVSLGAYTHGEKGETTLYIYYEQRSQLKC